MTAEARTTIPNGNSKAWSTVNSGLTLNYSNQLLSIPAVWTHYRRSISVPDGVTLPGSVSLRPSTNLPFVWLDTLNASERGPSTLSRTSLFEREFFFSELGTYQIDLTFAFTHKTIDADMDGSKDVFPASGAYTFHVGPVADLEVRDGGASPALDTQQRAYTVMAVNNGPDTAPAVQVTLTDVPEGAEANPSQGSYTQGTCSAGLCEAAWNVGELAAKEIYRASGHWGDGPTLTLVASGDPITAAIENTRKYSVCIDGDGADVAAADQAACEATSGNSWHSTVYYDYRTGNDSAQMASQAGSGEGMVQSLNVVQYGSINRLTWDSMDALNGFAVTHYEVQRSASPWETMATNLTETRYWDAEGGSGSSSYRVRAVNDQGVSGPWSQSATPHPKPGRPMSFTATGHSDTQATLTWAAPDAVTGVTVTGYDLEFSQDAGDTWTSLATAPTQTATTYTHTDSTLGADTITPDILRQYRARTVATVEGTTVKGDWATVTLEYPKPGAPGSFEAEGLNPRQAKLTWSAPDAVTNVTLTGYDVDWSDDGGVSWNSLATAATQGTTTTLTHTDNNLGAGDVRQYRVRAKGTVGSVEVDSAWAYALASTEYPAPGAPRNFEARALDRTRVSLTWSAPESVTGVTHTGYQLDYSTDGNTWNWLPAGQTRSTLSTTTESHTHDAAVSPGAIRQYRLRAVGTTGSGNTLATFESGWVFASVTTEAVGPPQNLVATADGIGRIDLIWDEPAFGADRVTGYRIDHTSAGAENWRTREHGWRTSPRTYEHTGLSPGQEYCYRVAATYAGGTGPFSARVCATTEGVPADLPGQPENLRVTGQGRNHVVLAWDAPSAGGTVDYYQWQSNIHEPREVTPRGDTGVTVRGLSPAESYDLQVRGVNEYGEGQWSQFIRVALNPAGDAVAVSPSELEVEKGGSGSFNVSLKRPPRWPLMLYVHSIGPECLTEGLAYQQFGILLPTNPMYPSKEFWEDPWWGPTGDRLWQPWNRGLDVRMDASTCRGGETTVVEPQISSLPFSYLEGLPLWEELGLDEDDWREKWGVDRLDGITGPSVKVTVEDGGTVNQQSGDPGGGAARPTAVALALSRTSVGEEAGTVTVTATLDAPAPEGGVTAALFSGNDSAAERVADYTLPDTIAIPAGQRSGTALLSIVDDAVDEEDETVNLAVIVLSDVIYDDLTAAAVLTITDDDTAGVTVSAANPLAVDEDGTATYTVVLDSQPTADVTVRASSDDTGAATVSPASHTFTPSEWSTPLTFTVRGLTDDDTIDESVAVSHRIDSDDWRYALVLVNPVTVSVSDTTPEQQGPPNQAPTVSSAIGDATMVSESETHQVSLAGMFSDADSDALTVIAGSGNEAVATVSVAADYASLTVTARSRGTAVITVTADDGRGGTVSDGFTVTVKAAPVVASAIADMSLDAGDFQDVTLSAVFSDADGDSLTITAESSDPDVAEAFLFRGTLTIIGASDGSATITVTAQDSDGNTVSDTFDVSVVGPPTPVVNLRCIAQTDRVVFLWDAPEWSGAEVYAYDYEVTLPGGRTAAGRAIGLTLLRWQGDYQAGAEASFSVKAVYELADESLVHSEATMLTCTVE